MKRRYLPGHYLCAAATAGRSAATSMYFRPHIRHGRFQGRRGYSDRYPCPQGEGQSEIVSGDSHCFSVQDANHSFRTSNPIRPGYNAVNLQPLYNNCEDVYGPRHPLDMRTRHQFPGTRMHVDQHRQSHRPTLVHVGPPSENNQQSRGKSMQQPFRPRSSHPPDYRAWEYANPGPPAHCEKFTVLSYNILADYLAMDHLHLYSHIPRYILDWSWRMRSINFELGLWSADILCFQEVDRFQDIESELKLRGYSGIWKMRTGDPVDGCATFWRVSRFMLLHEESIEYNRIGLRDNVAQICVLESLYGRSLNGNTTAPSSMSKDSNRIVLCNIHVLYNPKRGDIKLGQIRVLLERAKAMSNLWDDAPIIICGDFNCTPKSSIYNFISEQKLDLSKMSRDNISGQASAEIHHTTLYNGFRAKYTSGSSQVSSVPPKNLEKEGSSTDVRNLSNFNNTQNASPDTSYVTPAFSVVDETSESCIRENHMKVGAAHMPDHEASHNCGMKIEEVTSFKSNCKNIHQGATDGRHDEPEDSNFSVKSSLSRDYVVFNESEPPDDQNKNFMVADACFTDDHCTSETTLTLGSDVSQFGRLPDSLSPNFPNISFSNVQTDISSANDNDDNLLSHGDTSCSRSADLLDNDLEGLSFNEGVNNTKDVELCEDRDSFLFKLHNISQSPYATDSNSSSYNPKLISCGNEIQSDTLDINHEVVGGKFPYFSPAWTPMEIQTATGRADCKVMEHSLKLKSAYAEVQDSSGLRDPSGEPLVTSYHRKFLGTVDYIWLSEGLQASKVLAPIPKHVMQRTPGFPTKKWGSDHIALVSELAFTKGEISVNSG